VENRDLKRQFSVPSGASLRSYIPELTSLDLDPLKFPNMARLLDQYGSPKQADSGHTLTDNTTAITGLVGLPMIPSGNSDKRSRNPAKTTVQSDTTSYSHDTQHPKPNTPISVADTEQALFVSYQSIDINSPSYQHHQRIIDKNAPTNSGMIRGIKYKM
jgi:hypothetical protein